MHIEQMFMTILERSFFKSTYVKIIHIVKNDTIYMDY
jgi:hypothetical protein